MTTSIESAIYQRALLERLRREYLPPNLFVPPPEYPDTLTGPPHPLNEKVIKYCDIAWGLVREYRLQEDDEISKKQILTDLFICCEMLEQLGYKATAGIGPRKFLFATRQIRNGSHVLQTEVSGG